MTFRRTWQGVEWRAPMSDCSREAWNAPKGMEGFAMCDNGDKLNLNYARYVNGEEREVVYFMLDGVKFVPERTCEPRIEPWECNPTMFDAYCGNCGYEIGDELMRLPNYCEECGAKVVDECQTNR